MKWKMGCCLPRTKLYTPPFSFRSIKYGLETPFCFSEHIHLQRQRVACSRNEELGMVTSWQDVKLTTNFLTRRATTGWGQCASW